MDIQAYITSLKEKLARAEEIAADMLGSHATALRGKSGPKPKKKLGKGKRTMSASAKAKMRKAAKARWAAARAAGKNRL